MASDYARADPAKAFAERRGITFRERVAEIIRKVPEKARSIFANFRPPDRQLAAATSNGIGAPDQRRAVERYARAAVDIAETRQQGLPVLPHQRDALEKAGQALDVIRPHAAADLASSLQRQPELAREVVNGRPQAAIRAMQLEAEIRADPVQRASRFVSDWQRLGKSCDALLSQGNGSGASVVSRQMAGMAKSLERDPQVESLLRNRSRELGIGMDPGRDLARDLTTSLTMKRSRTLGMEI